MRSASVLLATALGAPKRCTSAHERRSTAQTRADAARRARAAIDPRGALGSRAGPARARIAQRSPDHGAAGPARAPLGAASDLGAARSAAVVPRPPGALRGNVLERAQSTARGAAGGRDRRQRTARLSTLGRGPRAARRVCAARRVGAAVVGALGAGGPLGASLRTLRSRAST